MQKRAFTFIFFIAILSCAFQKVNGQERPIYLAVEAGGILGLNALPEVNQGESLYGYRFRLVLGRKFRENLYFGLGLGNEVLRAPQSDNPFRSRFSMLPLLADFRLALAPELAGGKFSLIGNAGFAPRLGNDVFKGLLGQAALNYGIPISEAASVNVALGYGIHKIYLPYQSGNINQQSLSLTLGLWLN